MNPMKHLYFSYNLWSQNKRHLHSYMHLLYNICWYILLYMFHLSYHKRRSHTALNCRILLPLSYAKKTYHSFLVHTPCHYTKMSPRSYPHPASLPWCLQIILRMMPVHILLRCLLLQIHPLPGQSPGIYHIPFRQASRLSLFVSS